LLLKIQPVDVHVFTRVLFRLLASVVLLFLPIFLLLTIVCDCFLLFLVPSGWPTSTSLDCLILLNDGFLRNIAHRVEKRILWIQLT
jgi:hypothetical protein